VTEPDDAQLEDAAGEADEDDDEVSTPFDNPFFLPVILVGFAVWFIYDGWFNPDMEWIKFNRVGALVTTVLGTWSTFRALREYRAGRASSE
jgi:hypothetical protein